MNRAEIIGRLGCDPEIRTTQDGTKVANLSVATSDRWTDKDGQKQKRTEWHKVVIFGGLADVAERYLCKGLKVFIAGKLQTRRWQDKQGQDRYTTEIVINQFRGELEMLGDTGDKKETTAQDYAKASGQEPYRDWQAPKNTDDDLDDEIPF